MPTTQAERRKIFQFLRQIRANNNRPWFHNHRALYDEARDIFLRMIGELINEISTFDEQIIGLEPKRTTYRIHRDTRFSADKSPYKIHLGSFINTHGTKAFTLGYYLHLQPDECMLACGNYWMPPEALTAIRNDIVANAEPLLSILHDRHFKSVYGASEIGTDCLKTVPKGFPKDFPHPELIRPRAYCLTLPLSDNDVLAPTWLNHIAQACRAAKPFMDYFNATLEDYI